MQKELIIIIFVIIIMVFINFIAVSYMNTNIDNTTFKLEEISDEAKHELILNYEKKTNELDTKMQDLIEEWKNTNKKLAYFIEHDELEKVDTSLVTAKEYLEIKDYENTIPEINKCIFILNHIKDKEKFKIINLF